MVQYDTNQGDSGKYDTSEFPLLTDVGPFEGKEADQRFEREFSESDPLYGYADREVSSIYGVEKSEIDHIRAKLMVHGEGLVVEASRIVYWMDKDSKVAKIIAAHTDEPFRKMGVAKSIKLGEIQFMYDNGIDTVFTDVTSEGGYQLAKSVGFYPVDELDGIIDEGHLLSFDHEFNRGIMFKNL